MRVLVACEESQEVCKAFRALGHDAYSCDIEPCSGGHPEWHLRCDALELLKIQWDMILAFPPCTYLSNAGAKHLFRGGILNQERYQKGLEAKEFFLKFLDADCPKICVENPVSSRIYEMPPHSQEVQPWMFGHPAQKKTRLWLANVRQLVDVELAAANERFPQFHSQHEGWAVLKEEAEEAEEEVSKMKLLLECAWGNITSDLPANEDIRCLKQNAINAACEAIQAAAMCQKFLDMEGSIHDGEGGQ